jgi:MFS transporter, DHA1 family, tetracycline resistance protein
LKRPILSTVFLIVFVDLLGFGIIIPVLPFYAKHFGHGPTAYGLLLGGYSLMQFVFNPLWGRLSDRIGRRPVVLISVAGSILGFLLFGLARSFALLVAARLLAGIMNSNIAAAQSMVADVTEEDARAKGLGLVGAAFGMGFVLGPAIGGVMSRYGFGAPAFLAAGLSFVNLILAWTLLPETNPAHKRTSGRTLTFGRWLDTVGRPDVGRLVIIFFISTFAYSIITTALPYILLENFHVSLEHAGEKTGYLFFFVGVVITVTQGGIIRPLLRVAPEGWLVVGGCLLMLISLVMLPYSLTVALLLVALGLLALGNGISNPSLNSLISRRTASADQGLVLGTAQSMNSLGRFLGPIWGGFVYDRWGSHATFLSGGAFMGVAFLMSLNALRPARTS